MSNLNQVHHLDISGKNELKEMPEGIGKLNGLQVLTNFVVTENRGISMGELGALKHLAGYIME